MPIDLDTNFRDGAKIKVVGIGGGGGNAINNMIAGGLEGVDFIAANTDIQALNHNLAPLKIQVGREETSGLGAGGNPDIGKKSAEESIDEIREAIKGSDMVFLTAGMGGGTGTGGAPMIAKIAKEMDALVVSIVTKPFIWEGKKRLAIAEEGIKMLREHVDALIVIPNQRVLDIIDKNTSFKAAYKIVDEVLYNATRGISDIIGCHGVINVDFADVVTVMKGMGDALMGIGNASGENRAAVATKNALNSPLLDGISIQGAQGVLVNITGGEDMTMHEIAEAVSIVEEETGGDAILIHGVVQNPEMKDEISVTVVATGFKRQRNFESVPEKKAEAQTLPFADSPNNFEDKNQHNSKTELEPIRTFSNGNRHVERPVVTMKSPRGIDELTKFDTPAFKRRGVTIPGINRNPGNRNNS